MILSLQLSPITPSISISKFLLDVCMWMSLGHHEQLMKCVHHLYHAPLSPCQKNEFITWKSSSLSWDLDHMIHRPQRRPLGITLPRLLEVWTIRTGEFACESCFVITRENHMLETLLCEQVPLFLPPTHHRSFSRGPIQNGNHPSSFDASLCLSV